MASINIFKPLSFFLQAMPTFNLSNIKVETLGMLGIEPRAPGFLSANAVLCFKYIVSDNFIEILSLTSANGLAF